MQRIVIVAAALALAGTAGGAYAARQERTAAEKALARVSEARAHRTAGVGAYRATYHPGYISRISMTDARGRAREIYRQTERDFYFGPKPTEIALSFRETALALFDPAHQVRSVTVHTLDGETWAFEEDGISCPPICPEGYDSDSASAVLSTRALAAGLARPAVERALASVAAPAAHRVAEAGGHRATYHPGYISRISMVEANGTAREIYRQRQTYFGLRPTEIALSFRETALALFDPAHQVRSITVHTLDGETWSFEETGLICPPSCPEKATIDTASRTVEP